jgi:predicted nucleic acid-binding protein
MGAAAMMRLTDALQGVRRLGLDTSPFIYFIEQNAVYLDVVRELMRLIDAQSLAASCSVITITEVLTRPYQTNDTALANKYRTILSGSQNLSVIEINAAIADHAARLRADYRLRTPDALQLAAAVESGCDAFLCNDRDLRRVSLLRVLLLDELEL